MTGFGETVRVGVIGLGFGAVVVAPVFVATTGRKWSTWCRPVTRR